MKPTKKAYRGVCELLKARIMIARKEDDAALRQLASAKLLMADNWEFLKYTADAALDEACIYTERGECVTARNAVSNAVADYAAYGFQAAPTHCAKALQLYLDWKLGAPEDSEQMKNTVERMRDSGYCSRAAFVEQLLRSDWETG